MSSLKNVVKTRTYRERSQPKSRARLGMLEKHKDYVQRARDFHSKEDALRKMREKAALKNPDEFYFKMTRTKLQARKEVLPLVHHPPTTRCTRYLCRMACTRRRKRHSLGRTSWRASLGRILATSR